ncbi:MAG TPA: hypothetical protein VGO89_04345, partial [Streptomyces sp.]|nr:hypothetical protein [Streptomyces sp.]
MSGVQLSATTLAELRAQLDSLDGEDDRRRARLGAEVVLEFAARSGLSDDNVDEGPATAIKDLLANLRHLVRLLGLVYEELDRDGGEYEAEERGGGFVYDPDAIFMAVFGDPSSKISEVGFALACHEIGALVGVLEAHGR